MGGPEPSLHRESTDSLIWFLALPFLHPLTFLVSYLYIFMYALPKHGFDIQSVGNIGAANAMFVFLRHYITCSLLFVEVDESIIKTKTVTLVLPSEYFLSHKECTPMQLFNLGLCV